MEKKKESKESIENDGKPDAMKWIYKDKIIIRKKRTYVPQHRSMKDLQVGKNAAF